MEASETNPGAAADGVRVSVRVRPLNAREMAAAQTAKVSWNITNASITQVVADRPIVSNSFAFDHVFEQSTTNDQVFHALAKPVVASATEGINGVIFAYGQTAAGKTYTMLGTEEDPGVTRLSIAAVFENISKSTGRQFLLRASYIEIYNEIIRDLLAPDNDNLKIHEDVITKRVFVDSREEVVTSAAQVLDIIAGGESVRAVGETNMNDRSSRSHTIFSLKIESRESKPEDAEGETAVNDGVAVRASSLSLVDLAGSERASFTKAQGMRLVEGGHINKSLLTLGTVINKLSSGEARSAHIPYRDSKLTRLLQPALGGNARTAIVCAITPAILHMEETLSTLKFASRAKKVTNNAMTNEFLDDTAKLRRAEKEISFLKSECQRLKRGGSKETRSSFEDNGASQSTSPQDTRARVEAFEKRFESLLKNAQNEASLNQRPPDRLFVRPRFDPPSLTCALDLSQSLEHNNMEPRGADKKSETMIADLRKQLFDVEAQKRQMTSEMNYERHAMDMEIEAMVLTAEEANREKRVAEQECEHVNYILSKSQMSSFVDELVAETVVLSIASTELRETKTHLEKLRDVTRKNEDLVAALATLRKEHAEVVRRERRGVGPVLKNVKVLEGKLAEAEKKSKMIRQNAAKASSEKAVLERTLKERERQNKVLNGEIEKHRSHVAKGQARVNKEVAEEKKKFDIAVQEARDQNEELEARVKEQNQELASASDQLTKLEAELATVMQANATLVEESNQTLCRCEELEENVEVFEIGTTHLKQEISALRTSECSNSQMVSELTDELGKTHLELQETKSELSQVVRKVESLESHTLMLEASRKQAADECKTANESLRASQEIVLVLQAELSDERKENDDALCSAEVVRNELSSAKRTIETLQGELKKLRENEETVSSELSAVRQELEKQAVCVSELRRARKEADRVHQVELDEAQAKASSIELDKSNDISPAETQNVQREIDSCLHEKLVSTEKTVQQLQTELDDVYGQREKLEEETKIRIREVHRLTETIQFRDHQVYKLRDTLDQIKRGDGVVAVLETRVHKRDLVIGELNEKLRLQDGLLGTSGVAKEARSIVELEAKITGLHIELRRNELLVKQFEKERVAMIEESRKLRDRIKDRDLRRMKEVVRRKEERQEVRRNAQVLKPLSENSEQVTE